LCARVSSLEGLNLWGKGGGKKGRQWGAHYLNKQRKVLGGGTRQLESVRGRSLREIEKKGLGRNAEPRVLDCYRKYAKEEETYLGGGRAPKERGVTRGSRKKRLRSFNLGSKESCAPALILAGALKGKERRPSLSEDTRKEV